MLTFVLKMPRVNNLVKLNQPNFLLELRANLNIIQSFVALDCFDLTEFNDKRDRASDPRFYRRSR